MCLQLWEGGGGHSAKMGNLNLGVFTWNNPITFCYIFNTEQIVPCCGSMPVAVCMHIQGSIQNPPPLISVGILE